MENFLTQLGSGEYCSIFLYVIGAVFIYINRFQLLYEEGSLSLGRTWSWILFYLAVAYWVKYLLGVIPDSKPFPPALENMLYAVLIYEFAKRDNGILKTVMAFIYAIKGVQPPEPLPGEPAQSQPQAPADNQESQAPFLPRIKGD